MSDDPVKVCPKCGGTVKRLIGGGTGIIFKGSGFYITDSKKSGSASTKSASHKCETCATKAKEETA
jgi:predicted nucleic acid-binding Zn ribbon protein